jgi:hypothetical protein
LIGCEGGTLAAGCGLRFWAGLAMAVMSKANKAICLDKIFMGRFFSLWSEPRLKNAGMEGKLGALTTKDTKEQKGHFSEIPNLRFLKVTDLYERRESPIATPQVGLLIGISRSARDFRKKSLRVLCGYFFFFLVADGSSG